MGFFNRFKKRRRYNFNKDKSYDTRWDYYGGGTFNNPIASRSKRKSYYSKNINIKGFTY